MRTWTTPSTTSSSQNHSENDGKPRITRLLRSVRKRHLPPTRPPLPSFTGLEVHKDGEEDVEGVEEEKGLDTTIPKVWVMNEVEKRASNSTSPASVEIHVRPPTRSSRSGSGAVSPKLKREGVPVQAQTLPSRHLKPMEDPNARARKERKRRRKEILDMPLPDIPQETHEFEPPVQERRQASEKVVQYLPQEIYSHLFEVAEQEIRRASVGSTDHLDETLSVLSTPQTDVTTESEIPLGVVHSIIHSYRYRKTLSEMLNLNSTAGQAPNYAKVFEATAKDEQKVADLFEFVLNSEEERSLALSLRGADAESFMDALQHILDENKQCSISRDAALRSDLQKLLIQLSKRSTNLPESMFITGVEPVKSKRYLGGTFGDVYTSVYQGKPVALKMLRTFQAQADKSKIYKRFCKEAMIWHKLEHEFVLPFLGIDAENFPRQPCMVSPWMVNGTLVQFLKKNPKCNLDRLLYQIIQGVDYLHSQGVVHGDLKGGNILIDENCNPRLADFGLTVFAEATMQSTTDHGGTLRWMAPELLSAHGEPQRRSFASDVYAFACVCIEVYTGTAPFADIRNEAQVITQIFQGARPPRPEKMTSDSLWKIVRHCWQTDKDARPKSRKVESALRELLKSKRNTGGSFAGVERVDVPVRPFTPFATLEDSSLVRNHTLRSPIRDVEDEHAQCLKRVRRHADPHRMYHHLELLQQNSSVNLFTGRIKGTNLAVVVKQVDVRQLILTKPLNRLIDEFQDVRFLHHPNIVNYVDLFQYENHIWIVMDSMKDSFPLSKLLERTTQSGGLKESFSANVIRHVAQAVHYLHRHGIVHGSISTEHVLLGTGKNLTVRLKLGAMIDDPSTSSQKGVLLAPEARQGTLGPEADIWNLGLLGIAMWDSNIDLTRERDDLLLDVLQNSTPPTIPMRSYLNQTLNVKPTLRPTAASLLQHPFLCNVGTMRSGHKDTSGLNRSLTDPKQRSREVTSSSHFGRSRTSRK